MTSSQTDALSRSGVILSELNQQQQWQLTEAAQTHYLQQLKARLLDTYNDHLLVSILTNYHYDHQTVAKFQAGQGFELQDWNEWYQNVCKTLAHHGLDWSSQVAINHEDLVQIALTGLLEALPSYGYRSRFKTWAYTVFLRSVQQHVRMFLVGKRKGQTLSLDQTIDAHQAGSQQIDRLVIDPIDLMLGNSLQNLIYSVLQHHKDQRLLEIFRLAEEEDLTVSEIGRRFQLSPARISDLLKQARQTLQQDARIRDWYNLDSAVSNTSS